MAEQRYCIKFLMRMGYKPKEIVNQLEDWYQDHSLHKTQVYYWMAEIRRGREDLNDAPHPGRPRELFIDDQILAALRINPYASCRNIASMVGTCGATVSQRLAEMGYRSYLLRWIPHKLENHHKKLRFDMAKNMLKILQNLEHDHFNYIITGDESWFCYYYNYKRKWVLDTDEIDQRIEQSNFQPKKMVTIFIGINGYVLIDCKPPDQKITSEYFINNVLKPLEEITDVNDVKKKKKLFYIHFDNASSHSSKKVKKYLLQSQFTRLPHPPYSPDLSPCDFGLFGTMKNAFQGCSFESEDDLLDAIKNFLDSQPLTFWENIFNGWIKRLQKCIEAQGNYFE